MTPDWLATEDGKRAVEAMRKMWPYPYAFDETVPPMLTTALPHLDRLFRERYAKELDERAHKAGNVYKRNAAHAAAAFLRREPTL